MINWRKYFFLKILFFTHLHHVDWYIYYMHKDYEIIDKIEPKRVYFVLTRLASGSRHVCEFCESETALGDTISGLLLSLEWRCWECKVAIDISLSPERWDDEKERFRKDIARVASFLFSLMQFWGEGEDFKAPTEAMDILSYFSLLWSVWQWVWLKLKRSWGFVFILLILSVSMLTI